MTGANIIPGLDKLIEVAASGIGAVAGPMIARWAAHKEAEARLIEAKADADAKRIDAQAEADATVIKAIGDMGAIQHISSAQLEAQQLADDMTFIEETTSRVKYQECKRQSNIYNVVSMAADHLDGREVENHEVDHDWTARFFFDVQDVTSEQLQQVWARILSGEVETPGRTSLHALSILRNMSQRDATLFADAARFVIDRFILNDKQYTDKIDGFPYYSTILHLVSYGLLSTDFGLHCVMNVDRKHEDKYKYAIDQGEIALIILVDTPKSIDIPAYTLTPSGKQIYDNIGAVIDKSYLHSFAEYLQEKAGGKLAVAPIMERRGTQYRSGQSIDVLSGQPYQVS